MTAPAKEPADIPCCSRCGHAAPAGTKLLRKHRPKVRPGQPRPDVCEGTGQPPELVTMQQLLQRQGREIARVGDRWELPSAVVRVEMVAGRSLVRVRDEDPDFGLSVHLLTRHRWDRLKGRGRILPPPPES